MVDLETYIHTPYGSPSVCPFATENTYSFESLLKLLASITAEFFPLAFFQVFNFHVDTIALFDSTVILQLPQKINKILLYRLNIFFLESSQLCCGNEI